MAFGDRLRKFENKLLPGGGGLLGLGLGQKIGGALGLQGKFGGGLFGRRKAREAAEAQAAAAAQGAVSAAGAAGGTGVEAIGDPSLEASMGTVGYANSPQIPTDVPMNDVVNAAGPGGRSFEQYDDMGNPLAKNGEPEEEELEELEVVQVSPGRTEIRKEDTPDDEPGISAVLGGSF